MPQAVPLHGSCLCGQVRYEIRSEVKAVAHCHCRMCQKAHGAAFGSYGSVPLEDFEITRGREFVAAMRLRPECFGPSAPCAARP